MIPSHIGQYRILRKLGAGGMGLVFLGEHTLLGRRAAIKTLLPAVSANHEIVERFFNEARAASAISDPGVIQIFDFGYHVDGTAYIVMELLEGEALSARIDRLGKLPVGDALRIARQIAGSLAAAHARDIIHRDLKPENIYLVHDAEAQDGERTKILDFGICKVGSYEPTLTQSGAMIGTPVYMSPEQCRGAGGVDHRSDIYAFGCLMFHMLAGRPPFTGDAPGELIVAHLREDPPAPSLYVPEVPFAVDALVLRCLAKSPDGRFRSMTELQLALGDLHAQLDVPAPVVAAAPPTMPLGRGFRSVYDGNVAALFGSSSRISPVTHAPRPRLRLVPTSATTVPPRGRTTEDEIQPAAPRRASVRAVLACVLVVGVVVGLVATSFVLDADDHRAAAEGSHAAQPAIAGTSPPAVPANATSPATPATEDRAPVVPAVATAAPVEAPAAVAEDDPACAPSAASDGARVTREAMKPPSLRHSLATTAAAPDATSAAAPVALPSPVHPTAQAPMAPVPAAPPARQLDASSPVQAPSVQAPPVQASPAQAPPVQAPPVQASPAPPSPPTLAPAEDLYDTR